MASMASMSPRSTSKFIMDGQLVPSSSSSQSGTTNSSGKFLHLKAIRLDFIEARPEGGIEIKLKVDDESFDSPILRGQKIEWKKELYFSYRARIVVSVRRVKMGRARFRYAEATLVGLKDLDIKDGAIHACSDGQRIIAMLEFGSSLDFQHVVKLIGEEASIVLPNKATVLDKIARMSQFAEKAETATESAVESGKAVSEINNNAKAAIAVAGAAMTSLRQQRDCQRSVAEFMNALYVRLPLVDLIPEHMRDTETQSSLSSMLEVLQEAFKFVIKFSNTPTNTLQQNTIEKLTKRLEEASNAFKLSLKDQRSASTTVHETNSTVLVHDMDTVRQRKDTGVHRKASFALRSDSVLQHKDSFAQRSDTVVQRKDSFVHRRDTVGHSIDDDGTHRIRRLGTRRKLRPVLAARHTYGMGCLEGTRTSSIQQIMTWSRDRNSRSFWLYGPQGCGKTSMATSIINELKAKNMLAGSFFCNQDIPDQRDPRRVLPSLAYSITRLHEPYRQHIIRTLEDEVDISAISISDQLSALFLKPTEELGMQMAYNAQPYTFVIDALDECGDDSSRLELVECLAQIANLSAMSWLKIFITSRPSRDLARCFQSPRSSQLDLGTVNAEEDIILYTQFHLGMLANDRQVDRKWLQNPNIQQLASNASGSFIWISTAIDILRKDGSDLVMEKLLSQGDIGSSRLDLDALYTMILDEVCKGDAELSIVKRMLGIIRITSRHNPLSFDGLADFLQSDGDGWDRTSLRIIVDDLKTVLYEDIPRGGIIRVFHQSFLDFLDDRERCNLYWTSLEDTDRVMFKRCLLIMRRMLKFNICDLETSFVANKDIPGLEDRIRRRVPESLKYSCLHWGSHCTEGDLTTAYELVTDFFRGIQILYWLEVLSLIGALKNGIYALRKVMAVYENHSSICLPAQDTYKLLTSSHDAISVSTPHLYISALSFVPEESYANKIFSPLFSNKSIITAGRGRKWHSAEWINGTGDEVSQVAFSPDGHCVAMSSRDTDIHIWEAKSGLATTTLRGHIGPVWSIAFSPDGRQLVSGSGDCTVRVWDIKTGMAIGEPMTGHTQSVDSVCYSPNGLYIASRSLDRTVSIWDASTWVEIRRMDGLSKDGQVVYSPNGLKVACCGQEGILVWNAQNGHLIRKRAAGNTRCIAYSPNGAYLASGGADRIVRLLDGETLSELIALRGHSDIVNSVTFSPDDNELLSASGDTSMIKWSITSRKMIGAPFKAHEARIFSTVYSPDGRFIASGSFDKSVRLWDAGSVSESSVAQLSTVRALACSPDGRVFASAGDGKKIYVYDVESAAVLRTLSGHTDDVYAIAFSSDGHFIASGSRDRSVRIWYAKTGVELHKLVGHKNTVKSVVFTADGQQVISASFDKTVRRWAFGLGDETGEVLFSHDDWVNCIRLQPGGKLLASGGEDNTLRFSDPESGLEIGQPCLSDAVIRSLAFSSNGKYVAVGCENHTIQVWSVDTRTEVRRLIGHTDWVHSVSFTQDGTQLVSASSDHTIRQWSVSSGAELRRLVGHTHVVRCAIYTNDDKEIISGSDDGTVRIWNSDVSQNGYISELGQELSSLPLTDGWITSPNGVLLLWVPPEYRNSIRDMSGVCIPADAPGHPVRLDWSKLVKGHAWTNMF